MVYVFPQNKKKTSRNRNEKIWQAEGENAAVRKSARIDDLRCLAVSWEKRK